MDVVCEWIMTQKQLQDITQDGLIFHKQPPPISDHLATLDISGGHFWKV